MKGKRSERQRKCLPTSYSPRFLDLLVLPFNKSRISRPSNPVSGLLVHSLSLAEELACLSQSAFFSPNRQRCRATCRKVIETGGHLPVCIHWKKKKREKRRAENEWVRWRQKVPQEKPSKNMNANACFLSIQSAHTCFHASSLSSLTRGD